MGQMVEMHLFKGSYMRKSSYRLKLILSSLACLLLVGVAGCGDDENPVSTDQTPPTVNSTNNPANGATNVPLSASVTASFSEAMNASTISTSTFTLNQGATGVAGTVTYLASTGATFNPTNSLLPNSAYTATIATGAEDLAGNALEDDYVWSFTTGTAIDATPPIVASTVPENGATNVSINAAITAEFSEPLDPTTVTGTSFSLKQGTTAVAGAVGYSGNTASFTPSAALANATVYTATVTTVVSDLSGNALIQARVWTFTTASATDVVRPTVVLTVPANAATGIAASASVLATFSEPMNASTITTSTFTLSQGATPVAGVVSYAGGVATFNPTSNLSVNTAFTATITTGATDAAGNAIASAYVWTFTTSAAPDVTPPSVIATVPASGGINVSTTANITATFSEAMNAPSISASTFRLMQGAIRYDGVVSYSGSTLTFNPVSVLAPGALYTATIFTAASDLAGNGLVSNYTWTFTTIPDVVPPDVTPPTVIVTVPANTATSVATSVTLSVGFSERVIPTGLYGTTFTLMQGTTPIAGTVTYSGATASFDPTAALALQSEYTATITAGVADLAGNVLAADYVWSFTTVGVISPDAPTVIAVTPADEAIDVATVANITATFSEPMDPVTISTSTFTVTDGSGTIPGSVVYSGATATFNPSVSLAPSTIYAATITTGATDATGSPLAFDYAWIFLTEAVPEVTGLVPTADGLNVPISANVAASFSKPMSPPSLTTSSFVLRQGATVVAGSVGVVGATAIFEPSANLSPNEIYTATITTTATDLSGNPLAHNEVWSFTTGTNIDATAPTVTATDPAQGATNVLRGGNIRAFFSDNMDPTTLTTATFAVTSGLNQAVGEVTYSETIAIFTPSILLAPNTQYTATINASVEDISGNALAAQKVWTFTTGP